jgi:hypothetical protein
MPSRLFRNLSFNRTHYCPVSETSPGLPFAQKKIAHHAFERYQSPNINAKTFQQGKIYLSRGGGETRELLAFSGIVLYPAKQSQIIWLRGPVHFERGSILFTNWSYDQS